MRKQSKIIILARKKEEVNIQNPYIVPKIEINIQNPYLQKVVLDILTTLLTLQKREESAIRTPKREQSAIKERQYY